MAKVMSWSEFRNRLANVQSVVFEDASACVELWKRSPIDAIDTLLLWESIDRIDADVIEPALA